MVLRELKREFADMVYQKYLAEVYHLTACPPDYSEDRIEEIRLLTSWIPSGVKCPHKKEEIHAAKAPAQPLTIVNTVADTLVMEWVQSNPAGTWVITHNLGYNPVVAAYNTYGDPVPGSVVYLDSNNLQIIFQSIIGGKAYLYKQC